MPNEDSPHDHHETGEREGADVPQGTIRCESVDWHNCEDVPVRIVTGSSRATRKEGRHDGGSRNDIIIVMASNESEWNIGRKARRSNPYDRLCDGLVLLYWRTLVKN